MKKIGLIGEDRNDEIQAVGEELESLGATGIVIDLDCFPKRVNIHGHDRIYFGKHNLSEFDAFYVKYMSGYEAPELKLTKKKWIEHYVDYMDYMAEVADEVTGTRLSILKTLAEYKPFVNKPGTTEWHRIKPFQLHTLERAGVPVPPFWYGNSSRGMKRFAREASRVVQLRINASGRHRVVTKVEDIEELVPDLKEKPVFLEKLICGPTYRVYVLGDEIIASARIYHTKIDSGIEEGYRGLENVTLPEDVERFTIKAVETLGMVFSGVDLKYSDEEEKYYLLECNPTPDFVEFEIQSDIEISKLLAEYLISL